MGALVRATRKELADSASAEGFWEDVFVRIAQGETLKALCEERAWAFGEVLRTVRGDDGLSAAYDEARRGHAEWMAEEALEIGDGDGDVARDKLKIDVRMKLAGKWDRARYGDSEVAIGLNLDPLTQLLREISDRRLASMKVVAEVPAGAADEVTEL